MAGYGTDQGLTDWLASYGYTVPATPAPAVLRQRGSDYIDGLYNGVDGAETGFRWKGDPTDGYDQERSWPRSGAVVGKQAVADNAIPDAVIRASYMAAQQEGASPGSLSAVSSAARLVKRQKVGSLEREFFGPGDGEGLADTLTPIMTAVQGLLKPYLIQLTDAQCLGIWSIGGGC